MSLNQWVVLLSVILSAGAALANVIGAIHSCGNVRSACVARATLAAGYSVSYAWLFVHEHSRLHWSYVMSGVALVAWVVVWIAPPLAVWAEARKRTPGKS